MKSVHDVPYNKEKSEDEADDEEREMEELENVVAEKYFVANEDEDLEGVFGHR